MIVFLLVQGCGTPGPSPATVCASIADASETLRQLSASASTQATLLADLKGAPVRAPMEGRFHRQGERHRVEAHHRTMVAALCAPLVQTATALSKHVPGPHDNSLKAAAEALAPACADPQVDTADALKRRIEDVDQAVVDLLGTCKSFAPGEDQAPPPPDAALRCAANHDVLDALLAPVSQLQKDVIALEDERNVMRDVAAQPFDPDQIADSLTSLGEIEGTFGVRCGNLTKLIEDLTQRHDALKTSIGRVRALRKRCQNLPTFDMREPKEDGHDAAAAEAGIAMRELYKSMRTAYDKAFETCAPTPAADPKDAPQAE